MRPKKPDISTAIRQVFADRRAYTLAETSDLIGVKRETLDQQVSAGELEAVSVNGESSVPWCEVAYLALRAWPIENIFEALGDEASEHIPELLRPAHFMVMLPEYQIRMLKVLASRQGLDSGTFLQLQLLDLASACDQLLDAEIPGFSEAFHFPFGEER